jgi:hypothetical protein
MAKPELFTEGRKDLVVVLVLDLGRGRLDRLEAYPTLRF